MAPAARAAATALQSVFEKAEAPKLILITDAGCSGNVPELFVRPAANRMAWAISTSVPPKAPRARTGIIVVSHPTPATPEKLLVAAATVPAICVP